MDAAILWSISTQEVLWEKVSQYRYGKRTWAHCTQTVHRAAAAMMQDRAAHLAKIILDTTSQSTEHLDAQKQMRAQHNFGLVQMCN